MSLLDQLAEARIQKAQQEGAFDDLPDHGKPIELDDDSMIPEALRAGYRLLKNSGYLPPELQLQREIREVEDLLAQTQEAAERSACEKRLRLLRARLGESGRGASRLLELGRYHDRLLEKWEGD
ncbi:MULTISPECIES: DnaJ family domain-containing protein [unclassified Halomonas]|jgi:hypothetical protein|uniref:DUF1992 domain-containing protein n=2 Tax=unclassified Halomonas TaxID=2609666 RepID=A0AAU7KJB2_9GAMM|nr:MULTISPECIES: DnaJ family domain-containing protein [unclassified Halomonas]MBR9773385.1 DUF1992 domain-containing protein [Gammaproteobacteria bacterium]MAR72609.1 hypothetical protein [Halomonas sp.]MBR9878102.1 DUF1992 domain-containing protein [Gammaproteobacteria bacterium]MBY5940111.1 DUF1992 domain-containing protein [Halomonas sp. DP5N14-9]MBY6109672.1 DUF1992 domain-containing protein [Halomonas sp. DP1Y21-3]|tara:strand:- start:584 stop:955 length:372 start_codon:yes stop_codon:yes gene_type:complete